MPDDPTSPPRRGAFRRAGQSPPSLPKALAKVAGYNLLDVVAPEYADGKAEQVMQDYAEAGGDPGAHATAFGLAGAGGATLPPALMALSGSMGARTPKPSNVSAFLRTLNTAPVDPSVVGAIRPIEYIRPAVKTGGGKLAASLLAVLSGQEARRP